MKAIQRDKNTYTSDETQQTIYVSTILKPFAPETKYYHKQAVKYITIGLTCPSLQHKGKYEVYFRIKGKETYQAFKTKAEATKFAKAMAKATVNYENFWDEVTSYGTTRT